MSRIRVMIVEDTRVVREFLEHIIGNDPRLEVAASVGSAEEAVQQVHRIAPDVISMDIRLPGMNGFEATQRIMTEKPTPIVVVSASVESDDLKISMNALRAGALSVVEKPVGISHSDYEELARRLCTQLVIMSQVKVVRQRLQRGATTEASAPRSTVPLRSPGARATGPFEIVGLVASTGGPNALQAILQSLPSAFPLPIVLVQHITGSFLKGFVSWLRDLCALDVVEATHLSTLRPGTVHIAPADHHLKVKRRTLWLDQGEMICAQRPSGNVLLESIAQSYGSRGLAALLTGMGEDGAAGLKAIYDQGGYTIAEDASTTVVYGMPAAAVEMGAVCESLPLPQIGPRLLELVARAPKSEAQ